MFTRRFFYFLVFIYWRFFESSPRGGVAGEPRRPLEVLGVLRLQESFMIAPGSSPGNSGQGWRRWEPRAISGASEVVMKAARGAQRPLGDFGELRHSLWVFRRGQRALEGEASRSLQKPSGPPGVHRWAQRAAVGSAEAPWRHFRKTASK